MHEEFLRWRLSALQLGLVQLVQQLQLLARLTYVDVRDAFRLPCSSNRQDDPDASLPVLQQVLPAWPEEEPPFERLQSSYLTLVDDHDASVQQMLKELLIFWWIPVDGHDASVPWMLLGPIPSLWTLVDVHDALVQMLRMPWLRVRMLPTVLICSSILVDDLGDALEQQLRLHSLQLTCSLNLVGVPGASSLPR